MKKFFLLALTCIMALSINAQNLNEVWLLLQNGNIPGAKKKIDECMPTYQNDAKAWLYRGNVYMRIYNQDESRLEKNPAYVSRTPDAIYISYESFFKALEINPKIEAESGLMDPKTGQITCAGPLYNKGSIAYQNKDYETAKKYFAAAIKCFALDEGLHEYIGQTYLYMLTMEDPNSQAFENLLDEAVKAKPNKAGIYENAFTHYFNKKDLEKCEQIIKAGKKNVPDDQKGGLYASEIEMVAATGDTAKINKCFQSLLNYSKDTNTVNSASITLVNAQKFDMAKQLLDSAKAIYPNSFSIISMYAYCIYNEADVFNKYIDAFKKDQSIDLDERMARSPEMTAKLNKMYEATYNYALQAYNINPNDKGNNTILRQMSFQLRKELPAGLK